jgi:hypothetical protein
MNRSEFVKLIQSVAPALGNASRNSPILSNLRFDGETVTACDGEIALQTPCPLEFEGCVPGEPLLSLLNYSDASDVTFQAEMGNLNVLVELGETKAHFAVTPLKEFPSDFLDDSELLKAGKSIPIDAGFRQGIRLVSHAMGYDFQYSTRVGITCVFRKEDAVLYATDGFMLIRLTVSHDAPELAGRRLILSPRFCSVLLTMPEDSRLIIGSTDEKILVVSRELALHGAILPNANGQQFEDMIGRMDVNNIPVAEVPLFLGKCLERAKRINGDLTEFSYADGCLQMWTKSSQCSLKDSVEVNFGEHPIDVGCSAKRLSVYLQSAATIGFGPKCIVMRGANFQVLFGVH